MIYDSGAWGRTEARDTKSPAGVFFFGVRKTLGMTFNCLILWGRVKGLTLQEPQARENGTFACYARGWISRLKKTSRKKNNKTFKFAHDLLVPVF